MECVFILLKPEIESSPVPVVKTSPSNAGNVGSVRGQGAKITHALKPKTKQNKTKQKKTNTINNRSNTVTN